MGDFLHNFLNRELHIPLFCVQFSGKVPGASNGLLFAVSHRFQRDRVLEEIQHSSLLEWGPHLEPQANNFTLLQVDYGFRLFESDWLLLSKLASKPPWFCAFFSQHF